MLKKMTRPSPSLSDKLIARLEGSLQGVQTPQATNLMQHPDEQQVGLMNESSLDYSWQIFDQVSLQHFDHMI